MTKLSTLCFTFLLLAAVRVSAQCALFVNSGNDVAFCGGSATCVALGGAHLAVGGTPPYSYSWSSVPASIIDSIANPTVCPVVSTNYCVTVTDALGCTASDCETVIVHPAVVANAGPNETVCQGNNVVLGAIPTGSGGTPPFSYRWSPTLFLNNTTLANPTAVGIAFNITYSVTVTDSLGCTGTDDKAITLTTRPVANAGADKTVTACPGSFVSIGGSPTASGGSGNYSFAWTPCQPALNSCAVANPVVTGLLSTTTFTVIVTDNISGCVDSDRVTVTVVNSTLSANAGPDKYYCANSPSCITIGGNSTASGGNPPYSYAWSPGVIAQIANPCVSPTVTTSYCVTVTDGSGCTATECMTVTFDPPISFTIEPDTAVCPGECLELKIGGPGGGTPPYTYSWSGGAFVSNPTVCPVSTTPYTVTITDSVGCSIVGTKIIIVRPVPIADAGPDVTLANCVGDSAIIGGNPTASGTQGPYTYQWTPCLLPPQMSSCTAANPVIRNLSVDTTFCVTVTDIFGCFATDCMNVSVLPNTLVVDLGLDRNLCMGNHACITLGTPVSGGTPPYVCHWTGIPFPESETCNPIVCPDTTTTYTLMVTDGHNCIATDEITVVLSEFPPVASIIGMDSQYCRFGSCVNLVGSPAGGMFIGAGVSNNVLCPFFAGLGTHSICYVYCNVGCCDTACQEITVNPIPQLSVTGYNPTYCSNDDCDTLIGVPSGGAFDPPLPGNVFCPSLASPGNNVITYTDTVAGCANSVTITIAVRPLPTLTMLVGPNDTVCRGDTVTLCPGYSADVINIQYLDAGGNLFASGLNCVRLAPAGTEDCVVATATNNNGCATRDTSCIWVSSGPDLSIFVSNDTICSGHNVTLCPNLSADVSFFRWSELAGNNVSVGANCVTWYPIGINYCVLAAAADFYGCETLDTACIHVNEGVVAAPYNATICSDSSYSFNDQLLTSSGTYRDTLVADNGCDSIVTLVLSVTQCTGIAELNDDSAITLYPNPATDKLNIDARGMAVRGINIYNAIGTLVSETQQIVNNQINIRDLAAGIYVAEIRMEEGIVKKRWVKL